MLFFKITHKNTNNKWHLIKITLPFQVMGLVFVLSLPNVVASSVHSADDAKLNNSCKHAFFDQINAVDIAVHLDETELNQFIPSRYQKRFYRLLSKVQRHLHHCHIPRCARLSPSASAWRQVYDSVNDQALITLTGLDF
jgi:hypothetical protein